MGCVLCQKEVFQEGFHQISGEDLSQKKKLQNLVFPSGIGYNKLNGEVRTKKVNSIFSSIPMISEGLAQIKNGESINFDQFSAKVTLL